MPCSLMKITGKKEVRKEGKTGRREGRKEGNLYLYFVSLHSELSLVEATGQVFIQYVDSRASVGS